MSQKQNGPGFHEELAELQKESLGAMSILAGGAGYVLLSGLVWRLIDRAIAEPFAAWAGAALCLLAPVVAWKLRGRHLRLAGYVLVTGVCASIVCLGLAFPSPQAAYLFILPIVLAHALLSQPAFLVVALLCELVVAMGLGARFSVPIFSGSTLLPVGSIGLVTAALWFSVQHLHTTLAWALDGYSRAHRDQEAARERQAELRRALKALDEATYRLERLVFLLSQARDQADEARRLKQQFAQNVSHELRTPLSLIVGFTELMTESPEHYGGPLPPPYQRDLNIVYRNASHLQGLVNDVLDLARVDAAQMTLVIEEADPAALVQEAANTAWGLIAARKLGLRTEVQPGLPRLLVDPTRIRQVLINLLNNAARFTEQGGITIRVHQEGDEVIFAVADTGVGIAPEDLSSIFEEFRQADGTARRRHEGAGLGLAISRRFVELHGGSIWVESQVGQGSTFFFSLPVDRTRAVAAPDGRPAEAARATPPKREQDIITLVVTPNPSSASLLSRYMRDLRIVAVSDLEQARRAAETTMPQAVVVDQAYQETDPGRLAAIGREWCLARTPFVVCPLPGEEQLRRHTGIDSYLFKPIAMRSLWDALRQFGEEVDTVLVVDDDRDFVQLVSRVLESSPIRRYWSLGAHSGRECLDMLRIYKPDLVLLDLGLPDLDGYEVAERIRSTAEWRHIPIVAVTAQDALDAQKPLVGSLTVTRPEGLMPNEIVHLIHCVIDGPITPPTAPRAPKAASAP